MSVDTDLAAPFYDQLRAELFVQLRAEPAEAAPAEPPVHQPLKNKRRPVPVPDTAVDTGAPADLELDGINEISGEQGTSADSPEAEGYRVMIFLTNRTCRIGGSLTYEQAELVCDDLFKALVEPGMRLTVYVEEDT